MSDREARWGPPSMCAAPAATPIRYRCWDRSRERTRPRDRHRRRRFPRSAPSARSIRRRYHAGRGRSCAERHRTPDSDSAGLPPSPRDRAAGTAIRGTPRLRDTPRRDPGGRAAARFPVTAGTRAGGRTRLRAAPAAAPGHGWHQRSVRGLRVPLPPSLK